MTQQALAQVVQRSISDPAFRRQLQSDAASALRGYELSDDEARAIRTRDAARLTDYGIDRRMSKAFSSLDPGSPGVAAIANSEPRNIEPVWIGDNAARIDSALAGPDALDRNAVFTSESSETGGVQSPDALDRNAAFTSDSSAAGGVQSPDAMDRNLGGTVDERGDLPLHTYSGDDNAGPSGEGLATDEGQITGAFQEHMDVTTGGDGDLQQ